jgi:CRISPR-associated protein Csm2
MKTLDQFAPAEIAKRAEDEARKFAKSIKTHQLRNVFGAVSNIRNTYRRNKSYEEIRMDLIMLKPKMAYAAGRQKAIRDNFYPFMKEMIEGVENAPDGHKDRAMNNFFAMMESVIAYHKYHETA